MIKAIITLILTIAYIINFKIGYPAINSTSVDPSTMQRVASLHCYVHSGFAAHILFPLSHVNVFHLLCNLIALWSIRGKLYLLPAIAINLLASFLPPCAPSPLAESSTYGFSGIIFAIIGIKWGMYFTTELRKGWLESNLKALFINARKFAIYVILPLFITIFIPTVNFSLHFYTLILGIIYAYTTLCFDASKHNK